MAELEELKKENEELKKQLSEMSGSIEVSAFYSLRRILSLQAKRLDKFDLDKEIGSNSKEDKVYDRTLDIVVKMPKMISELNSLKSELKLTGNEDEDKKNKAFVDNIAQSRP
ncbi:MAG: hypothetical protein V4538_15195 [Bacteroidota bacterium]